MIANNTDCPTDEDLRDFTAGRLPNDRFGHLLSHLDNCESCQARAGRSADLVDSVAATLAKNNPVQCPIIAEADCQAALFQATSTNTNAFDSVLPPIESLGPYRLLRPLGRGGMGAVYLAEHERLRKKCAIKLLPRDRGFDTDWRERFDREMQAIASLEHPNIVTATDAGDGWHYLVMEYLDGIDLAALSRRLGPIPIDAAAAIGRDICNALSVVHEAGLVHRDIKPSNVMLTRAGTVKLLDLGLVLDDRAAKDEMRLTTVGHVMGTLAYAAPEQLSDEITVDSRADLYGLGATLFQLITGQGAHAANRGIAPLVIDKTSKPAPLLSSIRNDIPPDIDSLIARMLDRDPNQRLATADEAATELANFANTEALRPLAKQAFRAGEPDNSIDLLNAIPTVQAQPTLVPPTKRTWIAAALAAAALIAGFVFYIHTDRGVLVVESDNVSVSDSEVEVRRGDVTVIRVHKQSEPKAIANADVSELYKGKPIAYWVQIASQERDVLTLADAISAIVILAKPEDTEMIHSVLIAARRYGGWAIGSIESPDEPPSQRFMDAFKQSFHRTLPRPGIPAIIIELRDGNARSRAACWWALNTFRSSRSECQLNAWASDSNNRLLAGLLHDEIRRLVKRDRFDEPVDGMGSTYIQNAWRDTCLCDGSTSCRRTRTAISSATCTSGSGRNR